MCQIYGEHSADINFVFSFQPLYDPLAATLTESSVITLSPGHVALFSRLLKPAVCFRPPALLPVQRCQACGELPGACVHIPSLPRPQPMCPHCACAPLPRTCPGSGRLFDVPLGVIYPFTWGLHLRSCLSASSGRSGFSFSR